MIWLSISLGAMAGGGLRIILAHLALQYGVPLYAATLLANLLGCIAIGVVAGWFAVRGHRSAWRHFWQTGFCGGLTTLSLHSYDAFLLLREGQAALTVGYALCTLALCLAGLYVAKRVTERVCSPAPPKTLPPMPE